MLKVHFANLNKSLTLTMKRPSGMATATSCDRIKPTRWSSWSSAGTEVIASGTRTKIQRGSANLDLLLRRMVSIAFLVVVDVGRYAESLSNQTLDLTF